MGSSRVEFLEARVSRLLARSPSGREEDYAVKDCVGLSPYFSSIEGAFSLSSGFGAR